MIEPRQILFAIYDLDGRIEGICSAPESALPLYGDRVLECEPGIAGQTHYVSAEEFVERAPLGATWDRLTITGAETATLSGLPVPCTVHVDLDAVEVLDGVFEFSAGTPGDYRIRVDEVAYQWQEWIVDAN